MSQVWLFAKFSKQETAKLQTDTIPTPLAHPNLFFDLLTFKKLPNQSYPAESNKVFTAKFLCNYREFLIPVLVHNLG